MLMRLGTEQIGRRGLAVLAVTGAVGIGLAIHGYGHGELLATSGGVNPLGTGSGNGHSTPPASSSQSASTSSSQSASTSSSQSTATAKPPAAASTTPSRKLGPLLASTSYGQYAFRVYPGPETSRTRLAVAGFAINVSPRAGALQLSVATVGSGQAPQTSMIRPGDRVYFIEATLGDDSGDQDYNFGDDGVVVTDAKGHVIL